MCCTLVAALSRGEGICWATMSVKPVKSPRNLWNTKRSKGLTFNRLSSLVNLIPSSSQSMGKLVSTSPTTWKKSEKKIMKSSAVLWWWHCQEAKEYVEPPCQWNRKSRLEIFEIPNAVKVSGSIGFLLWSACYTPARTLFISGISSLEITIFYFKMMVKNGLDFLFWNSPIPIKVVAAQCKNTYPEWPNWHGNLAGISEGAQWISK